ncbi:MAG TPA: PBP1A family penicillin-binding protein [Gemmatimonadaceae bacterium]|nr:PBP1A family penicillin-binding protein [Gemmatimonadaceae bacterium]
MADLPFKRSFWKKRPRLTRAVLLAGIFGLTFAVGIAYASWTLVCRGDACPDARRLEAFTPHQTSKLYAADGRFIAELGLERRTLVTLDEIPKTVQEAFIVTEDKRFYDHHGIDWVRAFGAAFHNVLAGGYAQGFSTITMQLARNIFTEKISREKTLTRKMKEMKIARQIESLYPKQKILELYLNQIALGNGAYGVETASQRYFGKSVRDLNLAEAATLAALPKAPSRYNPRRFPDRAIQRRNTIIALMREQGVVSAADAQLAQAYPLQLARRTESGELAPYFVEWIRKQLEDQFGSRLYTQGYKVYTTLDIDMQLAAERNLEQQLEEIEGGKWGKFNHITYEQYQARNANGEGDSLGNSPYLQGAFVALDPRTGAVRALVGGRDFDDSKFNRATQALRQPGSTFKPIVYSTAIHNGYPLSYMLNDSALSLPQDNGTIWTPQNYDLKYEGYMPMRRALYQSRNLPTIRLGMELGERNVIDMARRMGLSTPIPPVPSISIGAADVYPIEMVGAYTTFATLGERVQPNGILRVEDTRGNVVWEANPRHVRVLSRDEAWLMVDVMKDVVRRGTAARVWSSGFHIPAGGKTGTTNDYADVWFIGYTSDMVAGVWLGFDQPQKIMSNAQGGRLAAPAWIAFMKEVYQRRTAPPDWPRPEDIIVRQVDETTGMLRSPFCPDSVVETEYFIPGTEPTGECNVHTPFGIQSPMDSAGANMSRPYNQPPRGARRDTLRPVPDPFHIPGSTPRRPDTSGVRRSP